MPRMQTVPLNGDVTYVAYSRDTDMYYVLMTNGFALPCVDEASARTLQRSKNGEMLTDLGDIAWECEQNMNDDTYARYQYALGDAHEAENSCLIKF